MGYNPDEPRGPDGKWTSGGGDESKRVHKEVTEGPLKGGVESHIPGVPGSKYTTIKAVSENAQISNTRVAEAVSAAQGAHLSLANAKHEPRVSEDTKRVIEDAQKALKSISVENGTILERMATAKALQAVREKVDRHAISLKEPRTRVSRALREAAQSIGVASHWLMGSSSEIDKLHQ